MIQLVVVADWNDDMCSLDRAPTGRLVIALALTCVRARRIVVDVTVNLFMNNEYIQKIDDCVFMTTCCDVLQSE